MIEIDEIDFDRDRLRLRSTSIEIDLVIQPWVIEADGMTTTGKMPGRAGTNGAGSDNGDREIQLSASAGITSA